MVVQDRFFTMETPIRKKNNLEQTKKHPPQIHPTQIPNPLLKHIQKIGGDDEKSVSKCVLFFNDHDIGDDEYSRRLNGAGLCTYMNGSFLWQIWINRPYIISVWEQVNYISSWTKI